MVNEKALKKLHTAIISNGFEIGDFETFKSKMQTPESRGNFYSAMKEAGFDLGDSTEFQKILTPTKSIEEQLKANRERVAESLARQQVAKVDSLIEENRPLYEAAKAVWPRLVKDVEETGDVSVGRMLKDYASFPGRTVAGLGGLAFDAITGKPVEDYSTYTSETGLPEGQERGFVGDIVQGSLRDPMAPVYALASPAIASRVGAGALRQIAGQAGLGVVGQGISEAVEPTSTLGSVAKEAMAGGLLGGLGEAGIVGARTGAHWIGGKLSGMANRTAEEAKIIAGMLPFFREMDKRRITKDSDRLAIPTKYMEDVIKKVQELPPEQRNYEGFFNVTDAELARLRKVYEQATNNARISQTLLPEGMGYKPFWNVENPLGLESSGDVLGKIGANLGGLVLPEQVPQTIKKEVFPTFSDIGFENALAATQKNPLSPYTQQFLDKSSKPIDLHLKTPGLTDVGLGNIAKKLGYDIEQPFAREALESTIPKHNISSVPFDPSAYKDIQADIRNRIRLKGPEQLSQSEAIAKVAADVIGEEMRRPVGNVVIKDGQILRYPPTKDFTIPEGVEGIPFSPFELLKQMKEAEVGLPVYRSDVTGLLKDPTGRLLQYPEIATPKVDEEYAYAKGFRQALKDFPARDVSVRQEKASLPGLFGMVRALLPDPDKSYVRDPNMETYSYMMDRVQKARDSKYLKHYNQAVDILGTVAKTEPVLKPVRRAALAATPENNDPNDVLKNEYTRVMMLDKLPKDYSPVYLDRLMYASPFEKKRVIEELRSIR